MKKAVLKSISNKNDMKNDMKSEYDFSHMEGAVRGKYYKGYRKGHQVIVHKENGASTVQFFKLEEGAVMLEPDVKKYFTDSASVNKALRSLIAIIPNKLRTSSHSR